MKILVVDDSRTFHAYIREMFQETQVDLIPVYDGSEAVDLLMKQKKTDFNLILLDWEMPVLSGIETLKILKQSKLQIPIIMVSTRNQHLHLAEAGSLGADEYVMKPFTQDILFDKIKWVTGVDLPRGKF